MFTQIKLYLLTLMSVANHGTIIKEKKHQAIQTEQTAQIAPARHRVQQPKQEASLFEEKCQECEYDCFECTAECIYQTGKFGYNGYKKAKKIGLDCERKAEELKSKFPQQLHRPKQEKMK